MKRLLIVGLALVSVLVIAADLKISQLANKVTPDGPEQIPFAQASTNGHFTAQNLANWMLTKVPVPTNYFSTVWTTNAYVVTNITAVQYVTNQYVVTNFVTREYVTNQYVFTNFVTQEYVTNSYTMTNVVTQEYVTNQYVVTNVVVQSYITNLTSLTNIVTQQYVTNQYVVTNVVQVSYITNSYETTNYVGVGVITNLTVNEFWTTNAYVTNLYVSNITAKVINVTQILWTNNIAAIATNATVQAIDWSQQYNQYTNASSLVTNLVLTPTNMVSGQDILIVLNAANGNYDVTVTNFLGTPIRWRQGLTNGSTSFTVTNGTRCELYLSPRGIGSGIDISAIYDWFK